MILKPPKGVLLNRSHPLARGLISCFIFNEGDGNGSFDASIGKFQPFNNNPAWTPTANGTAVDFSGAGASLSGGTDSWYDFNTDDFSIVTQVLCDGSTHTKSYVDKREFDSATWPGYSLYTVAGGYIQCRICDGVTAPNSSLATGVPSAGRATIAVVVDQSADTIRTGFLHDLDGDQWGIDNVGVAGSIASNRSFFIGYGIKGDAMWPIISVQLYRKKISDTTILALHNEPYAMFEPAPPFIFLNNAAAGSASPTSVLYGPLCGPLAGPI